MKWMPFCPWRRLSFLAVPCGPKTPPFPEVRKGRAIPNRRSIRYAAVKSTKEYHGALMSARIGGTEPSCGTMCHPPHVN